MPDEACFTCNYIRTTFADGISRGYTYRCSHCGKSIGMQPSVPILKTPGIGPSTVPPEPDMGPAGSAPKTTAPRPGGGNPDGRFFLLVGTDMTGPYRVAEIRYKFQAGDLSPDAKARRVGTDTWVPLADAVGALPPRPPTGPKSPTSGDGYWLLTGSETTGPFTADEVRAKLGAGALHRDTQARRVGTEVWLPIEDAVRSAARPAPAESKPEPDAAVRASDPAPATKVIQQHAEDVREKAFWTAIVITIILTPSPAVLTRLLGSPKAGLDEAITIWNVLWHTLPLTIAVAIDAGILLWNAKYPEQAPKTDKERTVLWCWLGGMLFGSMLLGGWLGKVEASEWSQARLDDAQSVQKTIDPSGQKTGRLAQGLTQRAAQNKASWPILIAVGAFTAIANYFTLYGPSMFVSSLAVGGFLGWVWAIKLPQVLEELDAAVSPPPPT